MNKKLMFLTALMSAAIMTQAGVLFTEDWNDPVSSPEELDASRWRADDGCFGSGIYSDCKGTFKFYAGAGDNRLYIEGENNGEGDLKGWWPGYALVTVPTFEASVDKVLVVETSRAVHEQSIVSGSATRTGIWLIAPDKSKWLLISDDWGECNWGYNPYSGTSVDYPVNNPGGVGYDIPAFNSIFAENVHGDLNLRIAADGSNAWFYMQDPNAEDPKWVYGGSIRLNFSENIAVGMGVYARAPKSDSGLGDYVSGAFGPLTVSSLDAVYFAKSNVNIPEGTSYTATVKISEDATPATVTLTSGDPTKLTFEGGATVTTLSFAKGETAKEVEVFSIASGRATIEMTGSDNLWVKAPLTVTCPEAEGVKMEDSFDGDSINTDLWSISDAGYETGYTSEDFFGVKNGQLVTENMVATKNYWGGKSLLSKQTFLGSTETSLKITVDFDQIVKQTGVAFCGGLILRNADNSKFFAIRNNRGEGGWQYNVAKGASGTKVGIDSDAAGVLEVIYNGVSLTMYLNGNQIASTSWVCNDPMYIELGFYAREEGASGHGAINSVKVENFKSAYPTGHISPSTVRTYPYFGDFTANLEITLPEEAVAASDVTVTLTSEDPSIATPDVSEIVFEQNGELTQYVAIRGNAVGQTTIKLSADLDWLTIPSANVRVYSAPDTLFNDDFSSGTLASSKWTQISRPGAGGSAKNVSFGVVDDWLMKGSFDCATENYPVEVEQINETFYPTEANPIVFEYTQGPIAGLGSSICVLGNIVNDDSGAACSFGYFRGDKSGWNMVPGYDFGSTAKVLNMDRFLDNGTHRVRMLIDGKNVYVYVDDIYGGSMSFAANAVRLELGAMAYKVNTHVECEFSDVYVYGVPTISISPESMSLAIGPDSADADQVFMFTSKVIREAGTQITLKMDDANIAAFDTGATKVVTLNASSPDPVAVSVKKVAAGSTFFTITNDKDYVQTTDTVTVDIVDNGELLLDEYFYDDPLDANVWTLDRNGFEVSQYPGATGDLGVYPGYGVMMDFTLTENYWGGAAYYTKEGYKASKLNPLTLIVDRESFSYADGATGGRCSIGIGTGDHSKWVLISESCDSSAYKGWGWNKLTGAANDKSAGAANVIDAFSSMTDKGHHFIKLVADGGTVAVYLDDVLGVTLDFPVTEDIHFSFGVYARQAGDNTASTFNNVKIYGTDIPAPNPPEIVANPADVLVAPGQPVSFTVVATGGDLTYTWFKDGTPIDYISDPTYTIAETTLADVGEYTVEVSNVSGKAVSAPAKLALIDGNLLFSDYFKGPELGEGWVIDPTPYEASNPNGNGTLEYTVNNGLDISFKLTDNYWGGRTFYADQLFTASADNPLTMMVDRESFSIAAGATGARCAIILSNEDHSKWIQFSDSSDNAPGYIGWGWNKKTGGPNDKDNGAPNTVAAFAGFKDKGHHIITVVMDGENAVFTIDGVEGLTLDFPVSEGIRLGVAVFARAVPDATQMVFKSVNIWNEGEPTPPTDLELFYSVEDGDLVLRWEAVSGASLEVAPTADSASWTIMEAELVGGAWQCRVPMTGAAAFYRLTK